MKVLRTEEKHFRNIPDYPFAPNRLAVEPGLEMHYVDEGPHDAAPVLMLHGEPSWSFLYRFMIPPVVAAGHRVLAPDLIGFGKSDKPADTTVFTYARHLNWLRSWLETLDLTDITLVCQDWGSLLGLRLATEHPDRFARIIVGNGMLPTGDQKIPPAFYVWQAFAHYSPWFPIGRILQAGTRRKLSRAELKAYEAPFPSSRHKAGARAFPRLVPTRPDDPESQPNRRAWKVLSQWDKPFITAFSDGDPITRGGDRYLQAHIPGASGQPHVTLRGGHFLQEDAPADFAEVIIRACGKSQ